jgi:lysozyme
MSLKAKVANRIIPAVLLAVLAAGGTATQIMDAGIPVVEGQRYVAYLDSGGVPTICAGITRGVKLGDVETPDGCARRNAEAIQIGLRDVDKCSGDLSRAPESFKAGLGMFAFNVGGPKYCGSTAARLVRAGEYRAACGQLPRWRFVAGKDCALAGSNCRGIIERRAIEQAVCEYDL